MKVRLSTVRLRWAAATFMLGIVLGACGDDSTGPQNHFDAERSAQALTSVLSATDGNEDVLASLALAGEVLGNQQAAAASLLPGAAELHGTLDVTAAMFPANLLGRTLVYDPVLRRYVVDETVEGAPENGVRFIYYAIDPITRRPAEPLNPLGYLDLTDESSPSSTRLGIKAVATPAGAAPVTLIDYIVDAAYTVGQSTFEVVVSAKGYLSDGTERLHFDLLRSLKLTGENDPSLDMSVDHRLELEGAGIVVELTADGHVGDGEIGASATLGLEHGGESVALEVEQVSASEIEGTVSHNGHTAIVIGGHRGQPTFTRPDGSQIGHAEVQALLVLRDGIEKVTEFADAILSVFDPRP